MASGSDFTASAVQHFSTCCPCELWNGANVGRLQPATEVRKRTQRCRPVLQSLGPCRTAEAGVFLRRRLLLSSRRNVPRWIHCDVHQRATHELFGGRGLSCGRLAILQNSEGVALFVGGRGSGWRTSQRCNGFHLQVLASPS